MDLREAEIQVLDLGCGSGGIAVYASENNGVSVTGIDYSDTEFLPAIEAGDIRKYLYIATV